MHYKTSKQIYLKPFEIATLNCQFYFYLFNFKCKKGKIYIFNRYFQTTVSAEQRCVYFIHFIHIQLSRRVIDIVT